ncbi:MAG: sigma 54-interacting transcriptional regulator [Myxococcota bacterium]
MPEIDTQNELGPAWLRADTPAPMSAGLVLAWSHREPQRVGEVGFVAGPTVLGRGDASGARVRFVRSRPGVEEDRGPLGSPSISRDQLELEPVGDGIRVRCVGRCPMRIDGAPCSEGVLEPGSTLELQNELVFVATHRVRDLAPIPDLPLHPFGQPDAYGIVGEGPAAWALRERVRFAASTDGHVLVLGQSGTGKELVARALHRASARADRPFVARNAATVPEGIVDAELFGHARNYPNSGMPEREGLIGEARHGTLFLDEIGSLRHDLQAHLLRVLDPDGEYTRLGESRPRRADLRVVAATNAAPEQLKPDFRARFRVLLRVPALEDRREDIPLIARHLLARASADPQLRGRFFDDRGEARVAPALVVALIRHGYELNVRELDALLWDAMGASGASYLGLPERLRADPEPGSDSPAPELDAATVLRVLERCDDNITEAAHQLGLPSRFALYRLLRKLGIQRS